MSTFEMRASRLAMHIGVGCIGCFGFFFSLSLQAQVDDQDAIRPVPILTGSTAYFTRVNAGQFQDAPSLSPLLLAPVGDRWLLEAKGSYSDTFAKSANGSYLGTNSYGFSYAQLDYIANRYVTVVAGRFTTPFGMYGERLAPNWIKALQVSPLTVPVTSGSSLGGMLRGGFPAGTEKVNFDYAAYFSTDNTNHILATQRSSGGRMALFFPGLRLEVGASFQQLLEGDHSHSAGLHSEWQPNRLPLTLRSEFVRQSGTRGSGYWIESVYRLSQVPHGKRVELAARAQQFFADSKLTAKQIKQLGALGLDTNQADGGVNYYFSRDVRGSASYGRQLAAGRDANIWVVGITYRFLMPLGPTGDVR
jgi:hypothetical protein